MQKRHNKLTGDAEYTHAGHVLRRVFRVSHVNTSRGCGHVADGWEIREDRPSGRRVWRGAYFRDGRERLITLSPPPELLRTVNDPRFEALREACSAGRRFALYSDGKTPVSSPFTLETNEGNFWTLASWIEAHANYADKRSGARLFRAFEVTQESPTGQRFFSAWIVEAGQGADGVTEHPDASYPDRFLGGA